MAGDAEVVSHWVCVLRWYLSRSSVGCHGQSLCLEGRRRSRIYQVKYEIRAGHVTGREDNITGVDCSFQNLSEL